MLISKFDQHVENRFCYNPAEHGVPTPMYLAVALCEEAGEVAGKVKKSFRDDGGELRKEGILDELGDLLYYITKMAHECGYTLADVMNRNVIKLNDRAARGVQKGDGDHR